jgi:hypothetical protein
MKLAIHPVAARSAEDLLWRLLYGVLLVLMVIFSGLKALSTRLVAETTEVQPSSRTWLAEARSQASIATSYALMAKSTLQSSGRDNRQERRSRP